MNTSLRQLTKLFKTKLLVYKNIPNIAINRILDEEIAFQKIFFRGLYFCPWDENIRVIDLWYDVRVMFNPFFIKSPDRVIQGNYCPSNYQLLSLSPHNGLFSDWLTVDGFSGWRHNPPVSRQVCFTSTQFIFLFPRLGSVNIEGLKKSLFFLLNLKNLKWRICFTF